ncbi:unnamed protein product [Phytophthora fragariaefolia]|uniref:Unnamed protein product n=1 Tax=Phytophthora fragariaefolia TaxID=1490495 RepID=A0A9W6TZB0_9STRA|nr:unnamed protein product [Phytophthora fragariaefolia]
MTKRKPGVMELKNCPEPEVNSYVDVEDPEPEGKLVISSVAGFEATSAGFVDSLPAELLINTGAIASPVDSQVLEKHRPGEGPSAAALVAATLMGTAPERSTVFVEGLPALDHLWKVALSLCSDRNGQTIVKVCNASEEDIVIQKVTALAAATVVPKSAFLSAQQVYQGGCGTQGVDAVNSSAAKESKPSREAMTGMTKAYRAEMEADVTDSKLNPNKIYPKNKDQLCGTSFIVSSTFILNPLFLG